MAIKVTRAVTKYGRYYKAGEVIQSPTGTELSLARIWGWETVAAASPTKAPSKADLVKAARKRGITTAGKSKADLIELLEE